MLSAGIKVAFIRYLFCFSFHFATELSELGLPRDCISTGFQHWFNEAVLIHLLRCGWGFWLSHVCWTVLPHAIGKGRKGDSPCETGAKVLEGSKSVFYISISLGQINT